MRPLRSHHLRVRDLIVVTDLTLDGLHVYDFVRAVREEVFQSIPYDRYVVEVLHPAEAHKGGEAIDGSFDLSDVASRNLRQVLEDVVGEVGAGIAHVSLEDREFHLVGRRVDVGLEALFESTLITFVHLQVAGRSVRCHDDLLTAVHELVEDVEERLFASGFTLELLEVVDEEYVRTPIDLMEFIHRARRGLPLTRRLDEVIHELDGGCVVDP